MIKLYKDQNKNNQIKEIIADLRKTQFSPSFKYFLLDEKIYLIKRKYNIPSWGMARKITWILTGDCKRQCDICNALGVEYAMYNPR